MTDRSPVAWTSDGELLVCTIVTARYSGIYEGASWLAWPLFPGELPAHWDGDDTECMVFWRQYRGLVGKGESPGEAYGDLKAKAGGTMAADERIHVTRSSTATLSLTVGRVALLVDLRDSRVTSFRIMFDGVGEALQVRVGDKPRTEIIVPNDGRVDGLVDLKEALEILLTALRDEGVHGRHRG